MPRLRPQDQRPNRHQCSAGLAVTPLERAEHLFDPAWVARPVLNVDRPADIPPAADGPSPGRGPASSDPTARSGGRPRRTGGNPKPPDRGYVRMSRSAPPGPIWAPMEADTVPATHLRLAVSFQAVDFHFGIAVGQPLGQ